ncbi:beta-ketoacyl synthase chain length factor [Magnetospirillum sp. 15-1]|uniref:beta-ketoacyl synthase chain length factor n=1 Tax=Magnetospirillum sp. 15-1 TaxID=1979370 RepID=UPI001482F982|nr:beta-ketoacyl synthase chain length factor [Magnetospirillum sp. 15-1]
MRVASQSVAFGLQAWAGWLPGRDVLAAGGDIRAGGPPLPASLRRRITPVGRKALEAAWTVLAGRPGAEPLIVLSSRHGEYARTLGLLDSLAASGEVSPAEFSLAVHHGLAGLLSIASGNHAGHTAVAAGGESFCCALLEAAAALGDGTPSVLLMHFDESLPPQYAPVGGGEEPAVALALLLSPAGDAPGTFVMEFAPAGVSGRDCPAVAFARLLEGEAAESSACGERMIWRWRHAA